MTKNELIQGTLDMLILQVLARGPLHGWGIAELIGQRSKDVLSVGEGSLYPALHRLQERGWVDSDWGVSENNRKAKFYRLTKEGRRQLEAEKETWACLVFAVGDVLKAT